MKLDSSSASPPQIPCSLEYSLDDGVSFITHTSLHISSEEHVCVSVRRRNKEGGEGNDTGAFVAATLWRAVLLKSYRKEEEEVEEDDDGEDDDDSHAEHKYVYPLELFNYKFSKNIYHSKIVLLLFYCNLMTMMIFVQSFIHSIHMDLFITISW